MTYMEIFSYTFDLTSKRGKSGVKERFPFWGLVIPFLGTRNHAAFVNEEGRGRMRNTTEFVDRTCNNIQRKGIIVHARYRDE